jgi:hypothetical protein
LGVPYERLEEGHSRWPRLKICGDLLCSSDKIVDVGAVDGLNHADPIGEVAVPTPTPARRAMASIDAPPPSWANTSRAATTRRSWLRRASACMGRPGPTASLGPAGVGAFTSSPQLREG